MHVLHLSQLPWGVLMVTCGAGVVPADCNVYLCSASSGLKPPAEPCAVFVLDSRPGVEVHAPMSLLVAEPSSAGGLKVFAYHAEGASTQVSNC